MSGEDPQRNTRCLIMKKILLVTYDNCDDSEVLYPLFRMREEGYAVEVASMEKRVIRAKYHFTVEADLLLNEVDPAAYDGLILPGGSAPEKIRVVPSALELARYFDRNRLPVAAICHGPQILISAGTLRGKKCTAYPGIRDDVIAAGGLYEDAEVVVDRDARLVTSRRPGDLPAFMREFVALIKA